MNKKSAYFLLSIVLSFCIYISLLFFIFSYISKTEEKSKVYTSKKNSFIEITLKENIKKKKKIIKKVQKKNPKKKDKIVKDKKTDIKKENINKSIKENIESKSLKSLFNSLKIKKIKTDLNQTKKANKNSRFKKIAKKDMNVEINKVKKNISATQIVKNLSLEIESSSLYRKSGEYNEYIGKISDMLDQMWQETPGTMPGNSAKVTVIIDKFGNFSYKIDSLSYNNDFNAKLKSFLDGLKYKKFPPYKDGDKIILKVNFKDE